tara:strand:+ start:232 stop:612 length:381 start_codon:yes stop_codon:yes gene_type:complete
MQTYRVLSASGDTSYTGSIAKIQCYSSGSIPSATNDYTNITIKDIQFGTYVNGTGPGFESGSYAMSSSNVTTTIGQIALGVGDTIEAPMVGLSISGTKAADEGKGLLIFFNNNSADHGGYYHMNPS